MEGHNLLVVSDLHLCEGLDPESGTYCRQEDFLSEGAFARFLRYHEEVKQQPRFGGRPWMLIFNGDLFDFPQVDARPKEGEPLLGIKGVASYAELSPDEWRFGLGTTSKESEWKLVRIAQGHQRFFAAVGWFIAHGNHVAIIKGNHDVELHWPAVQERFVVEVERAYTQQRQMLGEGPPVTSDVLKERIHFYPWFYYEPDRVYIEHGGQYESSSSVPDYLNPVSVDDPTRLQVIWGNLFIRYLFNKIEDVHPFADNVKPPTRYLVWALRKDPFMTLWLILTRGLIFLRAFWKVTRAALEKKRGQEQIEESDLIPLPGDVAEEIAALAQRQARDSRREWIGGIALFLLALGVIAFGIAAAANFLGGLWLMGAVWTGGVAILYVARRIVSREVPSFDDLMERVACELKGILKKYTCPVRYVVLGHDHIAAIKKMEDAWYVNTGTWVQIFEWRGPIEGREKLTFFRLACGYEGLPELLCWDDAAGEPGCLRLGLFS
jgi:UDP-2,3-diacylglucosamine pyrophosphatase LpxH